jgi:hypothetical protein
MPFDLQERVAMNVDRFPTFRAATVRARRSGRWVGLFCLGWLFVLLLVYVITNATGGRALERELAQIRDRGEALTVRELAPPPVPDAENAALVYQRALLSLPRQEAVRSGGREPWRLMAQADENALRDFTAAEPAKQRGVSLDQVRQALAGTEETAALTRQAAAMPRCAFPVDWDAGTEALFPHLGPLRSLARLLAAEAIVAARDGKPAEAVANLRAIQSMAQHIGQEPVLISQLVQYACLSTGQSGLRRILGESSLGEAECREIADALAGVDVHTPFARAVEGERSFGLWIFDAVRRRPLILMDEGNDAFRVLAKLRVIGEPLLKQDELFYLRQMSRCVTLAKEPGPGRLARENTDELRYPWYALVSRIVLPAFSTATNKRDEMEARLALARWGLALHVYRKRFGQYPPSLDAVEKTLAWDLPKDPISGRELAYQRQDDGYLLYSFGVNQQDDGGRHRDGIRWSPAGLAPRAEAATADDVSWHIGA